MAYEKQYNKMYAGMTASMIDQKNRARHEEKRRIAEAKIAADKMAAEVKKQKDDPWNMVGAIVPGALSVLGTAIGAGVGGPAGAAIGGGIGGLAGAGVGAAANQFGYTATGGNRSGLTNQMNQQSQSFDMPGGGGNRGGPDDFGFDDNDDNDEGASWSDMGITPDADQSEQAAANSNIGAAFAAAAPQMASSAGEIVGNVASLQNAGMTDFEISEVQRAEEEQARRQREQYDNYAFNQAFNSLR